MSAAKCIKPPNMEEAPPFRQYVLAYAAAREAFAKIRSSKLNENLVWRALWDLACREEESRLQAKQWYQMEGLPLATMRRFPNRCHDWAKEIEMVSRGVHSAYGYSPVLLPAIIESQVGDRGKPVPRALASRILKARVDFVKLTDLPNLLRLFADYIDAVHKLTAHFAPQALPRYKRMTIIALVDYVKWATGAPHFSEIATLITAAYSAQGSSKIVDAHNLSMQYSRHSRRKQ
jgi:hypothetical protein